MEDNFILSGRVALVVVVHREIEREREREIEVRVSGHIGMCEYCWKGYVLGY